MASVNRKIVDHSYKFGDKFMLNIDSVFIYITPYRKPFYIIQCWTNGMFKIQCGAIKNRYNIHSIKP